MLGTFFFQLPSMSTYMRPRRAFIQLGRSACFGVAICIFVLVSGCAEQGVRDKANQALRDGNYEQAFQTLSNGLNDYPESASLRAGLNSLKNEAVAKLSNQANQLLQAGKLDEAEKTISRALNLDPQNSRLLDIRTDVGLARKQLTSNAELSALLANGQKEQVLRRLEVLLRDAPRQSELIALQRRIQQELRFEHAEPTGLSETRPITLDFKSAPLSAVLDAITRGSGVNFVLDKDLRLDSRATVYLREARVEDATDMVLGANQLAKNVLDSRTVFIYPNTPEKRREHQEQVVRVFYLVNSPATTTAALLRSMLRIKDPFVDERANMIAIRESPDVVALAERLVALHDLAEPEVMLEVEVMDVSTTVLNNLGLDFPNSFTFSPLPEEGAAGLTLSSLGALNPSRIGISLPNLVLNLRREVGDSNILANPKIRARNKEKARILIGDKIPIITSTSSATGFVGQSVNYQEVGLKLDVEPIVSPDDDVTIKIALEVSNLGSAVTTSAGTVAYQIGTRNASTTLRLRDGETQLLAGLINKQDITNAHRFPGLGSLPIAGRLFASERDDQSRTELVLAITPRILRSAPRPTIAQAEMWVGSELASKVLAPPQMRNRKLNPADTNASGNEPSASKLASERDPTGGRKSIENQQTMGQTGTPIAVTWVAPTSVNVGETFIVSLHVQTETPIRGMPLELGFVSKDLDVIEVSQGPFFKNDGTPTSFTQTINLASGRIGVGVLRSDSTGIIGNGTLVDLKLRALHAGMVGLDITSLTALGVGTPASAGNPPKLKILVRE